jgi:hypothetical protein
VTFNSNYILDVGGHTLNLTYYGLYHETGNTFIWHEQSNILMQVDIVFPRWVPFMNLGFAGDVPNFRQAHLDILSYPFDKLVTGHLGRWATRADVLEALGYFDAVRAAAADAVTRGYEVALPFNAQGNFWAFTSKLYDLQRSVHNDCARGTRKLLGAEF